MRRFLLIGACAFFGIGGAVRVWAEDSFILLPETQSPDGRFAIGWGLPKHPEVWNKARLAANEQAESLIGDISLIEEDVVNYLVDLRAAQALSKLGSHYWLVADSRPNRHHLDVVWSAASDLVLVNQTFRWDCRAFEAVRISEGKLGARLDLKKALNAKLLQFFKKALPRGSAIKASDLAISFADPTLVSGQTFKTTVEAEFPTKGENAWSGQAELRFALNLSKESGIALKVIDLK
jgi:hypothetical protein